MCSFETNLKMSWLKKQKNHLLSYILIEYGILILVDCEVLARGPPRDCGMYHLACSLFISYIHL